LLLCSSVHLCSSRIFVVCTLHFWKIHLRLRSLVCWLVTALVGLLMLWRLLIRLLPVMLSSVRTVANLSLRDLMMMGQFLLRARLSRVEWLLFWRLMILDYGLSVTVLRTISFSFFLVVIGSAGDVFLRLWLLSLCWRCWMRFLRGIALLIFFLRSLRAAWPFHSIKRNASWTIRILLNMLLFLVLQWDFVPLSIFFCWLGVIPWLRALF
jgi:hypothetical protein